MVDLTSEILHTLCSHRLHSCTLFSRLFIIARGGYCLPKYGNLLISIVVDPKTRFRRFRPIFFSASKRFKPHLANKWCCLYSFTLSYWFSWILYGSRPNWRGNIRQVEVYENPSYCAPREIDCLGFSCTVLRRAAISWPIRPMIVFRRATPAGEIISVQRVQHSLRFVTNTYFANQVLSFGCAAK